MQVFCCLDLTFISPIYLFIIHHFAGKGAMILRELLAVSKSGRAAKQQPTLFALALCARYSPADYKSQIRAASWLILITFLLYIHGLVKKYKIWNSRNLNFTFSSRVKKFLILPENKWKLKNLLQAPNKNSEYKYINKTFISGTEAEKKRFEYLDRLHHAAYQALPVVARISTHLFLFVKYCELISNATKAPEKKSSSG